MSNQPTNVTTGQVRLSYVHLFTPYAHQPGQEPKYSVTMLIPKSDIATKQRIDAAIQAAIQLGVASKWGGIRPPQPKTPIWDGDGVRQNGEAFGPECKGHWVMTASSKQQQAVVDASVQPILNQTEIYSGIYGRVNINFFPYSNSGNRGIGCGLGPVQKLADGEPLGNQMSAEAAFGDPAAYSPAALANTAPPAAPAYAPAYPQQPVQPAYQQPGQPVQSVPSAQPMYPQPGYAQQPAYPQQPAQPVQSQPVQIDPITGKPINGGVMGI